MSPAALYWTFWSLSRCLESYVCIKHDPIRGKIKLMAQTFSNLSKRNTVMMKARMYLNSVISNGSKCYLIIYSDLVKQKRDELLSDRYRLLHKLGIWSENTQEIASLPLPSCMWGELCLSSITALMHRPHSFIADNFISPRLRRKCH